MSTNVSTAGTADVQMMENDARTPAELSDGNSHRSDSAWKPLRYFNFYRMSLSGLFCALVLLELTPRPLGQADFELFVWTAAVYFVLSVMSSYAVYRRYPAFDAQVFIQVFIDIVAITLLMHASGGVSSGFGVLLVVAIVGGSLLTEGRIAVLFAAIASLTVLTQQIHGHLHNTWHDSDYMLAGMLGGTFFVAAFLAYLSAQRIRASEALAAKREVDLANLAQLNEHIIQRMQAGILAIDSAGRVRFTNESARVLLGLNSDAAGMPLNVAIPGLSELLERWRDDSSRSSHLFQPKEAQIKVVASFAALGMATEEGVLVFLEDASAMTLRAQQLKLASLGQLAASIAHEIRNPLGAISHAGQLLGESTDLAPADHRLTQIIRDNSQRMNAIIENVLRLSRRDAAEPEAVPLSPWVEAFVDEFATNQKLEPGKIVSTVEPSDLSIRVDRSQLHQVVWNLCENGLRHAKGTPAVQLCGRFNAETHRPYLDIIDTGDGIPPEQAERIFEPFFTTRSDGSGLGLYIARELCEGNQASLNHIATTDGCCFRITFADPRRKGVPAA